MTFPIDVKAIDLTNKHVVFNPTPFERRYVTTSVDQILRSMRDKSINGFSIRVARADEQIPSYKTIAKFCTCGNSADDVIVKCACVDAIENHQNQSQLESKSQEFSSYLETVHDDARDRVITPEEYRRSSTDASVRNTIPTIFEYMVI